MINIEDIKKNVIDLSSKLDSLKIDSIFLEQNNKIEKVFYSDEALHELRSCAKLLVAMAVGIAIDRKMFYEKKTIDYVVSFLNSRIENKEKI